MTDDGAGGHHDADKAREAIEAAARSKRLLDDARIFEQRLKRAVELLDPYMDSSQSQVRAIYEAVGGARRQRAVIELLDKQISLLGTLKQTLERAGGKANGSTGSVTRLSRGA